MFEARLALVGFGNVGKAFSLLLEKKQSTLIKDFGFSTRIIGIATKNHGVAIDPLGIDIHKAFSLTSSNLSLESLSTVASSLSITDFIRACPADFLFENSPVNHQSGQPAIGHLKFALEKGMHAITANKGPVVHAFPELLDLAKKNNRRFLFESAVMDGAPIFSLFRGPLPAIELEGFFGILNSCTNLLLELMEQGKTFNEAVTYGQIIGITETDPSADIDGWDAAIKVAALSTVLMGIPLKPNDVDRTGIREISPTMISEALEAGERWKLVCTAKKIDGKIEAVVGPRRVNSSSPLYSINGTSSFVQFETDCLPGLGILESNPGPETTAYGLLADLINAVRSS
jgi:homoserine dehydrogenase